MLLDILVFTCLVMLLFAAVRVILLFMLSKPEEPPVTRYPFREFPTPRSKAINFNVFERRAVERRPANQKIECRDLARVVYSGTTFEAKLVDISPAGCRILSNTEIPPTALLYLKESETEKTHKLAFVAYCESLGEGYQAGLEFLPQR